MIPGISPQPGLLPAPESRNEAGYTCPTSAIFCLQHLISYNIPDRQLPPSTNAACWYCSFHTSWSYTQVLEFKGQVGERCCWTLLTPPHMHAPLFLVESTSSLLVWGNVLNLQNSIMLLAFFSVTSPMRLTTDCIMICLRWILELQCCIHQELFRSLRWLVIVAGWAAWTGWYPWQSFQRVTTTSLHDDGSFLCFDVLKSSVILFRTFWDVIYQVWSSRVYIVTDRLVCDIIQSQNTQNWYKFDTISNTAAAPLEGCVSRLTKGIDVSIRYYA